MKYLVTGGKGFIGSHLVDFLVDEGHEVIVIDNNSTDTSQNCLERDGAIYYDKSVQDLDTQELYDGVDTVFHLAARARIQPSIINPIPTFENNVLGTLHVLHNSKNKNVRRVVYSASSSMYGSKNDPPHHPKMVPEFLNPYSLSKWQGEEICEFYSNFWGLSTIRLRYFNVYGPREPREGQYATVIGIFKRQRDNNEPLTIVGNGEQRRDFTFVKDVVKANWLASQASNDFKNEVLNIGTGENYSINEIANLISDNQIHIPNRPGETKVTLADIEDTKKILSWKPEHCLVDAIKSY